MLGKYNPRGRYDMWTGIGSMGLDTPLPEIGRAEYADLTADEVAAGGFVVPMESIYGDPARVGEAETIFPYLPPRPPLPKARQPL